eukprot:scaffold3058_cov165-Ochromonas_danica.AAC.4
MEMGWRQICRSRNLEFWRFGGPTFFVGVSPSTPTDNTTPSQQQQQQLPSQTPLKSQTGQQQQLYSWGIEGHLGQLGQGLNKRECTDPARIASVASTAFVQVSSGEAFTIALDTNGLGYAFGENFSGQLALYRKHKNEMIYPQNALIEEMTFIPRLMPFTMQLPLRKVSCGQRFVVAITKDGRLFSWGAGESGQLGTGRCTKKDIPSLISFPTTTTTEANSLTVQDVACGSGHTLALLSDGTLYSWGLNQRGQCGTGDILVRHSPTKIDLPAANMTGWKEVQGKVEEAEEGAELKLSFYPVRPEETVSSPKKQSMSMMMTPSAVTPSPATRSSATGLSRTPLYEIEVSARIITPSTTTTTAAVIPTTHESIIEQPQSARTAETNQTGSSSAKYPEATYWLECQPFAISNELQSVGQLLELNCQLSLNKQDFTANPSKQEIPGSLCHAFQPLELSPDCYALADLNHLMTARQKNEKHANDGDDDDNSELSLQKFERKVIVHGESFFPSSRLQKGAHIKAFCVRYRQPEEESTLISKLEEEILEGIDPLLVTCQSSSIMQFSLSVNCLTQIHHVLSTKNPSLFSSSPSSSSSSGVQLDFVFALESSRADGSTEMILLNQKPLSIFFYADSPLTISPNWCRKTAEQIFEITPTGSVGFPFHPIHAMVQVRFADDLLPLQTFSNSTLAIVPIIQDQHKNDEEQQHEVVIEEEKSLEEKKELTVVTEGLSQQQQPQQQHASAYKISFQLHLPDSTSAIPDHCIVSLALDGKSFSSQTATVALLSSLAKYTFQPALPKGGAPPNSTVGLLLEQHCPPLPADMICVRLYGSDESVGVTVPAVMSDVQAPATVLQFTLPDQKTMKELAPIVQGKEKLLHVAVSIDGGKTFDNPEKPMLQVK